MSWRPKVFRILSNSTVRKSDIKSRTMAIFCFSAIQMIGIFNMKSGEFLRINQSVYVIEFLEVMKLISMRDKIKQIYHISSTCIITWPPHLLVILVHLCSCNLLKREGMDWILYSQQCCWNHWFDYRVIWKVVRLFGRSL